MILTRSDIQRQRECKYANAKQITMNDVYGIGASAVQTSKRYYKVVIGL